ncbi:MAG: ATP-binding cassette domain-containing protein, partial [Lachnospiraceae bacterium]|nr:ATP-binding cassette domain-containing protein [Lachnospiraceae bacterium]
MDIVLDIKNLKKYYNNVKAVENVSFSMKQGELVVIIGPSGAGKSTVLRCINRMVDATDGEIWFEGKDIV